MKKQSKSSWGGARKGAGRKPRAVFEARETFYAKVDEKWGQLVENVLKMALNGDKDVLKWILDQRIGRATKPFHLGTDQDLPIPILVLPPEATTKYTEHEQEKTY